MEVEGGSNYNKGDIPLDYQDKVCRTNYIFIIYSFMIFCTNTSSSVILQVEQLKELSKQPDIYERLTRSLAPNIWELDDVKKGLLCQVP